MKAIINGKIIHNRTILEGDTLLFDEKIISIERGKLPDNCEVIDAEGTYVSAGFVDIHIHGSGGADVMDGTPEALETISETLLQTGTTSFVATTMTMRRENILDALENIVHHGRKLKGAKVAGIHLEGPFINPARCGAQDAEYIQKADFDWIEPYREDIRMITLAPEMPGAGDFIRHVRREYPHILLSIGHSDADYDEAQQSFGWGIRHVTHLFNAMPQWHHRGPGIVGAVFDSDGVTADIIADLVHCHPSALRMAERMKHEKLILITDAMRAGCLKGGTYELGGQKVTVEKGRAMLENGVLAGSVLKLNEAVRNFHASTEASLVDAVSAVTSLPAKRLGIPAGELREGHAADIVIFDEHVDIRRVYVDGLLKFRR